MLEGDKFLGYPTFCTLEWGSIKLILQITRGIVKKFFQETGKLPRLLILLLSPLLLDIRPVFDHLESRRNEDWQTYL